MAIGRIIVGTVLIGGGFFAFMGTMFESAGTPISPPTTEYSEILDTMVIIIIEAIAMGIGVVVLASGIKARSSLK